jgi:outer membrane protein TolC
MTSRLPLLIGTVAAIALLGGCGYERQSVDTVALVADLRAAALPADILRPEAPAARLSPAQIASLAVIMHPELKRRRAEVGISEAQIIAAGLLPNPTIDAKAYFPGGGPAGEASLFVDVTDLLAHRGPRREAARLRRNQVQWQIVDAEWRAAHAARRSWIAVALAEARLTLAQEQAVLAERTAKLIENGRHSGNATDLDVIQASIQAGLAHQEVSSRQTDVQVARTTLNHDLGLPPGFALPIGDLAMASDLPPVGDPNAVVAELPDRRPDLIALIVAYDVNEAELRGAYRKWIPGITLGPSVQFGESTTTGGVALGVELPLFNYGQAEIAAGKAGRTLARATLNSALATAWSEAALAAQREHAQQVRLAAWKRDIAPLLEREISLLMHAAEVGEIDPSRLIIAQDRLISLRDQEINLLADVQRASVDWDEAIGPATMALKAPATSDAITLPPSTHAPVHPLGE